MLAERIPKGGAFFARDRAQGVDGDFADAARRRIEHAQEGHVVVGEDGQAHVGEDVLDLGALVEAEAAQQAVANAAAAKGFFKGARLRVGAVEHGDVRGGIDQLQTRDLGGDVVGLGLGVARLEEDQVRAFAARGFELFADALLVVGDDGAGGVQNFLVRAVVLLDAQDARAGKILGEAQDVADVGAAPAVDGLVLVADDAEIRPGAGQQPQQVVLHAVGVLVFVDVKVAEALLPGGARVIEAAQHFGGAQEEIVEIERAGSAQRFFVGFVGAGGGAAGLDRRLWRGLLPA